MMQAERFTIAIPDAVLADLRVRLARMRWPDEADDAGWAYGIPREYMQEIVTYWRDTFDWRERERELNAVANFRASVGGRTVHFVHERSPEPGALPLLITHGWPSSFVEMLRLIPLLTDPAAYGGDPADAFHVVIPSIPGYAFSEPATQPGFTYLHVAALWAELMDGLGYARYGAHAYDVGATIMTSLCLDFPDRLVGYHTNEPETPSPWLGAGSAPLSDAERAYLELARRWYADEGGYDAIMTTRPQTLGYGLNDSPAGLAAWIIEKWHAWTDPPGGTLDGHFKLDELLTNVTLYWVTETINSANRLYYERAHHPRQLGPDERIQVPFGVALTNQAIERPPREHVERVWADLRQWDELERGGHFVALEEPELLVESIRRFFRPLRG
jgi:pimeloyl-ACP methyl ester carboxylesterase